MKTSLLLRKVSGEPDFAPLRPREDFRKLLRDLEEKVKAEAR